MEKSPHALEATALCKSFGPQKVVDDLSFRLGRGEIFSLLGPNGAGKTTTIKILYGSIRPDAGAVFYEGRDFARFRREIKLTIGVCSQNDTIDYDLSVSDNLEIFGTYYRIHPREARARAQKLLAQFGLDGYREKTARQLSGGLKRRLQIARALINRPRVLFLDEPTVGLDPHLRHELWDLLHQLREEGITILLTTHYMEEAEALSDHLMILDCGRAIEEGRPEEVIRRHFGNTILQVRDRPEMRELLREGGLPFFRGYGQLTVYAGGRDLEELQSRIGDGDLVRRRPHLEDVFIKLTGREL